MFLPFVLGWQSPAIFRLALMDTFSLLGVPKPKALWDIVWHTMLRHVRVLEACYKYTRAVNCVESSFVTVSQC